MQKTFFVRYLLLIVLVIASILPIYSQEVNWLSWEEAVQKSQVEPKKIFVDVYTEWCSWCKKMDDKTFTDPYIVQYLNTHYYSVKLDAQQKEDIVYGNKTYGFVQNGINSFHQFAYKIMNGKMKYPTVVFLDEDLQVIQPIPGYRGAMELELFLVYFGEDNHHTQPWFRFKKNKEPFQAKRLMPIQHKANMLQNNRN